MNFNHSSPINFCVLFKLSRYIWWEIELRLSHILSGVCSDQWHWQFIFLNIPLWWKIKIHIISHLNSLHVNVVFLCVHWEEGGELYLKRQAQPLTFLRTALCFFSAFYCRWEMMAHTLPYTRKWTKNRYSHAVVVWGLMSPDSHQVSS